MGLAHWVVHSIFCLSVIHSPSGVVRTLGLRHLIICFAHKCLGFRHRPLGFRHRNPGFAYGPLGFKHRTLGFAQRFRNTGSLASDTKVMALHTEPMFQITDSCVPTSKFPFRHGVLGFAHGSFEPRRRRLCASCQNYVAYL